MTKRVKHGAVVAIVVGLITLIPTLLACHHYWELSQECQLLNALAECEPIFDKAYGWLSWPLSLQATALLVGFATLLQPTNETTEEESSQD